jgi:hypothetical protein
VAGRTNNGDSYFKRDHDIGRSFFRYAGIENILFRSHVDAMPISLASVGFMPKRRPAGPEKLKEISSLIIVLRGSDVKSIQEKLVSLSSGACGSNGYRKDPVKAVDGKVPGAD